MSDRNNVRVIIGKVTGLGKQIKSTGTGKWQAQCPAHDDKKASLSITKNGGKVLMFCHAGCHYRQITSALGFKDTNDRFTYRGRHGKTRYTITRTPDKRFPVSQPDGTTNIQGIERVLYNLPEVCAAPMTEPIYIPEGEQACDNLMAVGAVATCNPFGAGKWRPEFNPYFKGRKVVLLADNDNKGREHVEDIKQALVGIAKEIRIPELDGLAEKGDITNWLQAGNTIENLRALVAKTKPVSFNGELPGDDEIESEVILRPMAQVEDRPLVWFWHDKIPDHGISMIQGDPGVSKSFLTIYMAAHISTGAPWPDCPEIPVEKGNVLIFCGEDAPARIKERCGWMDANMSRIFIAGMDSGQLDIRQHLNKLQAAIDGMEGKCRLIIFDPITAYMGNCRANNNNEVRAALDPLNVFAADNELTIIAVNHMNKRAGEKYVYRGLGSMGFTAVCRSVWGVVWDESDDEHETRIMCPVKANYSRHPSGLKYQIIENAVEFTSDPYYGSIDDVSGQAKEGKASKAEEAADWLRDRLKTGAVASKTLTEEAEAAGFKSGTLWRAKKRVGIKSTKSVHAYGGWFWEIEE